MARLAEAPAESSGSWSWGWGSSGGRRGLLESDSSHHPKLWATEAGGRNSGREEMKY